MPRHRKTRAARTVAGRFAGVLATIALATAGTLVLGAPAGAAEDGLPANTAAKGYVGLCDETGHNVTGGSVDTKPFIWKAVASTPPPAAFQGQGQNAVLNAYQPRPQVNPAEWSGQSMTAASFYSTKTHPAVQATYGDLSLAQFVTDYPPMVNGLYSLRIYYGKANYGLYSASYPTTTIQVVGKRWHVVAGGTVDCGAAKGVSNEQLTGVVTKSQVTPRTHAPAAQTTTGGAGDAKTTVITQAPSPAGSGSPSSGDSSTGAASAGSTTSRDASVPGAATHADSAGDTSSGSHGWVWFVVVPIVVLAALAGWLLRRRLGREGPTA